MLRILLSTLLFLTAVASAQETMIRQVFDTKTDTHVEVLALFTKPSAGGYFPVRVKIANNLKVDRSIKLDFEATDGGYNSDRRTNSSFSFTTPGGQTQTRDILVPVNPASAGGGYNNQTVTARLSGSLGQAANSVSSNADFSVLLSDALFTPNASALDAALSSSGRGGRSEFAGKFDPRQLPDDWLAYSGYDAILMTDTDWSNIPPGARNAILSWVRLGGDLKIYITTSETKASLNLPIDSSFGNIELHPIHYKFALDPAQTIALVEARTPRRVSLSSDFGSSWPLQRLFGEKPFRYVLFIVVLIIFGILVGPINLFVFAKSGRRHRLFITTPLISLGASLILIALILFQDGFGGKGQRIVLMEVRPDGDQNAAFVHQEQFARTGVLTKSTFTLDQPAVFTPVPIEPSRWARFTNAYNGAKGTFNLQPNSGKLDASGDWFQSRSEHGHHLSAVVPTRGRIERTAADQLVSTFDFPLETLFHRDREGKWHRAENIQTGQPFTLSPIDATMADPALDDFKNSLSKRNSDHFGRIRNRPDHFIAITTHAPAIATHPGIRWEKTTTILTGPIVSR